MRSARDVRLAALDARLGVLAARRVALALGIGLVDAAQRLALLDALGETGGRAFQRSGVVVGGSAGSGLVGEGGVAAFGHAWRIPSAVVVITFLSDYGLEDDFVGVCHAVMAGIAPDVRVVDLAHGIARHDVRSGALVLRRALPFAPPGVHLAVVDPEVGGRRRAVALRCADDDRILVGPDNGLLLPAAETFGGVVEAVEIGESEFRLRPVAATFHGRDLFAPVAAAIAGGAALGEAGRPIDVDELTRLDLPSARVDGGEICAHALVVDRYGNVTLDALHVQVSQAGLRLGSKVVVSVEEEEHDAQYATTFADVAPGELLLYEDAYRTLALAVNRGSAADRMALALDDEIRLRPAEP